ncbi:ParA family protein [Saccharopolyspora gregorii]|uniref:CobQ/CobB/MinD/ParA nucleotide binding domain-containing protein n=1 Tax=Saccharopolyspora gregorii TaxID=33914 RepID=A0ABP6RK75_9PSEU
MSGMPDEGLAPPEHLFTWVDVDDHLASLALAGRWPDWLLAVDGWWDGIDVVVTPGTGVGQVERWFDEAFGAGSTSYQDDELVLRLDDPRASEIKGTPIMLTEASADDPSRRSTRPVLRDRHVTKELAEPLVRPEKAQFASDVQLVALHSFKGGVGRTVHAVAIADAIARSGGKVLLVDADLEAPGITWMHREQGAQLDFGYEDLLALLQGAEDGGSREAVEIAAAYLPNQRVVSHVNGGSLTVVPASRGTRLGPPRIEPVDLLIPGRSPYFLTEAIAELAAEVGADTVVIDLRAGASELSAPVLLDPRVQRIFVTTLSHQSIAGTHRMLRQLSRRAPAVHGTDPAASVIITQYRQDAHGDHAERVRAEFADALSALLRIPGEDATEKTDADGDDTEATDADVLSRPVLSPFREELLALPGAWDSVVRLLARCGLPEVLEPIVPVHTPVVLSTKPEDDAIDYDELRRQLMTTAKRLKFAEQDSFSSTSEFLVTEPLRHLLGDHRTEAPLVVVAGAKGAGKTFLHAKACVARSWDRFAERSGVDGVQLASAIVPVLESTNLDSQGLTPQQLRDEFAMANGSVGGAESGLEIRDRITRAKRDLDSDDELGWRDVWLRTLAAAAGVSDPDRDPQQLLTELGARSHAVFLIDGLEDLFQDLDDEKQKVALRVLLTDVLAWLRSLRGRPFGLVVFVRQDLVTLSVPQNSGQLLGRYARYALEWNREEALRLALWVAGHAGALPRPMPEAEIIALSADEVIKQLIPLWGWKMGTEKSKEARSHLWVPAALGDFNEQVQARDVVVFLAEAAEKSLHQSGTDRQPWTDRVLAPGAMRKALLECSQNKIGDIKQENPAVGGLLTRLQNVAPVVVPFDLEKVGLSTSDADFLVKSGVLDHGTGGLYFVAEIYRHALGFVSRRRAPVLRQQ